MRMFPVPPAPAPAQLKGPWRNSTPAAPAPSAPTTDAAWHTDGGDPEPLIGGGRRVVAVADNVQAPAPPPPPKQAHPQFGMDYEVDENGQPYYTGQWVFSPELGRTATAAEAAKAKAAADEYKAFKEQQKAAAVQFNGGWGNTGWTKDAQGNWVNVAEYAKGKGISLEQADDDLRNMTTLQPVTYDASRQQLLDKPPQVYGDTGAGRYTMPDGTTRDVVAQARGDGTDMATADAWLRQEQARQLQEKASGTGRWAPQQPVQQPPSQAQAAPQTPSGGPDTLIGGRAYSQGAWSRSGIGQAQAQPQQPPQQQPRQTQQQPQASPMAPQQPQQPQQNDLAGNADRLKRLYSQGY